MENNNISATDYIELQNKYISLLEKHVVELEAQKRYVPNLASPSAPCYRYGYHRDVTGLPTGVNGIAPAIGTGAYNTTAGAGGGI